LRVRRLAKLKLQRPIEINQLIGRHSYREFYFQLSEFAAFFSDLLLYRLESIRGLRSLVTHPNSNHAETSHNR